MLLQEQNNQESNNVIKRVKLNELIFTCQYHKLAFVTIEKTSF